MKVGLIAIFSTLSYATMVYGVLNGPCYINLGSPGACLTTTECRNGGGVSYPGFCSNDPANVQCCIKNCPGGKCQSVITCGTTLALGYCPGSSSVRCCQT
ncbi:hypothetical protein BKA70DRAFT_1095913 [Coprinopsis sp. MPI-PUGE-AT-0042]|nr:hypothetical protein BKA70DRAFT_1095913 [Coprinopsis sp. MPI-PUGE-AT-0042]